MVLSLFLCQLILAFTALCPLTLGQRSLQPRFFNPPRFDSIGQSDSVPTTTSAEHYTKTIVLEPESGTPTGAIACVPPIESFTLKYAAISACPLCPEADEGITTDRTNQTRQVSRHSKIENIDVTFKNPILGGTDIECHLSWDTGGASPNKFPVAKQMDCDKDIHNQLDAVVEKQASGVTAGFYLFVWNNNQMETMVAWMVGDILTTNRTGVGWMNGTKGIHEHIYLEGPVVLNSMPSMKLTDWLEITANATG